MIDNGWQAPRRIAPQPISSRASGATALESAGPEVNKTHLGRWRHRRRESSTLVPLR
jgi:hypothetical protein